MQKIDLIKEYKELYSAKSEPKIINVPEFSYITITGKGDPNKSTQFKEAVESLYSVSYTIKFMIKKSNLAIDYKVMPLEGQWWIKDMSNFINVPKDEWLWRIMIMQPNFVTDIHFENAKETVRKKKNLTNLSQLKFEKIGDGISAQVLYVGPFKDEGLTIAGLHEYITNNGYKKNGKHREIYISDIRRTPPEKLKTIIRQPVMKPE